MWETVTSRFGTKVSKFHSAPTSFETRSIRHYIGPIRHQTSVVSAPTFGRFGTGGPIPSILYFRQNCDNIVILLYFCIPSILYFRQKNYKIISILFTTAITSKNGAESTQFRYLLHNIMSLQELTECGAELTEFRCRMGPIWCRIDRVLVPNSTNYTFFQFYVPYVLHSAESTKCWCRND